MRRSPHRGIVASALLAAAVLAGCAAPTASNPDPPQPGPESLRFSGCRTAQVHFALEPGSADPYLPPGFRAPLLATGAPFPFFIAQAIECDAISGPAFEPRPASMLQWFFQVDPPEDRRAAGRGHYLVVGAASDDADVARVLRAWGLGSAETARIEASEAPSASGTTRTTVSVEASRWTAGIEAEWGGPTEPAGSVLLRFFLLDRGETGEPEVGGLVDAEFDLDPPDRSLLHGDASMTVDGDTRDFPCDDCSGFAEHHATAGTLWVLAVVPQDR